MEGRLVFKNCSLLRVDGAPRQGLAVVVEGERVREVLEDADCPVLPGDWAVSCAGRVLMPGRIDCHARLVEALLGPGRIAGSVSEVEVLTSFALARALRDGVTCIHELLCHPEDVSGALRAQGRAAQRLGVRLFTAHASSPQAGSRSFDSQVDQNLEVLEDARGRAGLRFALGWRDVGTTPSAQRRRLGAEARRTGAMLHWTGGGEAPFPLAVEEWMDEGLLGRHSLCAQTERSLSESGTFQALLPGDALPAVEAGVGLGSGHAGSLQGAFSPWTPSRRATAELACTGPWELGQRSFGVAFGEIEPGRTADLTLYDAALNEGETEARPSEVFRVLEARAAWVVVAGRVVIREGQLLGADFLDLAREASAILGGRARAR